jgi:hypothetical protein
LIIAPGVKHPFLNAVHEGFTEFFADGDLFAADDDLVVADGFEAGDVDDIGVVDAGEGSGGLVFDVGVYTNIGETSTAEGKKLSLVFTP